MPAETIGLIAGAGDFPLLFAREAKRQGARVIAVALAGVTDKALGEIADEVRTFKLGQISGPLKSFKRAGVRRAVMAGKVQHKSLFGAVLPDLRAVKLLAGLKDRRTDTILSALADEFAKEGIELIASSTFLSHMLPKAGVLSRRAPNKTEAADIDIGWRAAKAVSGFDIGQSVAVKDRAVVAVEAMEGTDAMLRRAGQIVRSAAPAGSESKRTDLVLVKVAKPRQDFRFDLPVLGLDTLGALEEAGASTVAFEAAKTLLFDQDRFIERADAMRLAVVGIEHRDAEDSG